MGNITHFDQEVFLWLNAQHSPFWDVFMKVVTNKLTWIPLYLLLLYSIVSKFKLQAVGYILCILAVVLLSDQIASALFKPYFMRPRPCHDPAIASLVHLVSGCGGAYGFVSSHASTGFGIAMIVNLLPTKHLIGIKWFFLWAVVYSYSRIYVGVHYPLDVIVGGMIGLISAFMVYLLFKKTIKSEI
ncbi:phosphatase PAP2 family protein [Persicitalea sp.]|uniref:phosphatase PAP2 family protein n=1 Tax=Persicitalea sp. TaxID=3100273 RepID=UPI0035941155